MSVAPRAAAVALAGGVAAAISAFAGCRANPAVSFDVTLPPSVAAAWVEVAAFDGVCPEPALLGGGLPTVGSARRSAFRIDGAASASSGPVLGDLPKATYAFLAVAKREDCGVVATGCTQVDLSKSRSIAIALTATDASSGSCSGGTVCRNARCVPGLDNADPSVGARCSLQLLGAGPLANPLGEELISLSAPAIVATANGFLIAYREWDGRRGSARLTLLPVDSAGGALAPAFEDLSDRCIASDERDAVGLAMNAAGGLVVVARAACPTTATALNVLGLDPSGAVARRGVVDAPSVKSLVLSSAHALAAAPGTTDFFLAATRDARGGLSLTHDVTDPSAAVGVGGAAPLSSVRVAASDSVYAVLASSPGGGAPASDGGADGTAPTGDGLRLQIARAGADPATLGAPTTFTGTWGSVAAAAQSTRVVVVSDGEAFEQPLVFHFFDVGASSRLVDGYTPDSAGEVLFADVAFAEDRLFTAIEQPGALTLVAFARATTTPTLVREVSFARDPRIPSVANVRDGRVAVAASTTRVAVAWTTAERLGPNDNVGGYAVFACRAP